MDTIKQEAFDSLDQTLAASGPVAVIDQVISGLTERGEFRALLDAMLLKARHELDLPLIQSGTLADLAEPVRSKYEDRYVEAIRKVGGMLLEQGDVVSAWPYYRAIGEREPVAAFLEDYAPSDENGEDLGKIVEIAFNQGAHPRKGFQMVLANYGTCSAISSFEHLPQDESIRKACAEMLVRTLHENLVGNLRADVERRGQPLPPEGTSIPELIEGKDWLFFDDAYHIDISHLSSVVRLAPTLDDPKALAVARELTEYGRRLSARHRYEGDPPFEDTYEDHRVYLNALLGDDVDASIAHFKAKLPADSGELIDPVDSLPAQTLVRLLMRVNRLDDAIEIAATRLAGVPESMLICPSVAQLCRSAGRLDRLAKYSRDRGDLVHYAAAILDGRR